MVLVGSAWNPDVESWKEEEIILPRKDTSNGDLDDFVALKSLLDGRIKDNMLCPFTI